MAIAFDVASSTSAGTGSSLTFSHTCTGADRILIVGGGHIIGHYGAASDPISGVTYAAAALTKIHDIKSAINVDTDVHGSLWYKVTPATGANNIVITYPVSVSDLCGIGLSYTGVNSATPIGTGVEASGTTDPAAITVTSAAGEMCVDFVMTAQPTISINAGNTSRREVENITSEASGGMSEEAGAASVGMGWTFATGGFGDYWVELGVPLKPAGAAAATSLPFRSNPLNYLLVR